MKRTGAAILAVAMVLLGAAACESAGGGGDTAAAAQDVAAATDVPAATPDTGPPVDPLACSLTDYGSGLVWDGEVQSESTGPEPAPMTGITEAHNAVRRHMGLAEFAWSDSLAFAAQTWADHLADTLQCNMQHDTTSGQGENLAAGASTGPLNLTPQRIVGGWACERGDWDNDERSCQGTPGFGTYPRSCGHYTQVVWSSTTEVGCGVATCDQGVFTQQVWVCRYTPPGNYVGQAPY